MSDLLPPMVATNGCHRLNRPLLCFSEGGRQELLDNGVATAGNLPATPIVEQGEDEDDTTDTKSKWLHDT